MFLAWGPFRLELLRFRRGRVVPLCPVLTSYFNCAPGKGNSLQIFSMGWRAESGGNGMK